MQTTDTNAAQIPGLETPVTIEKLVYGGDGLARVEGHVVFIPYVLPGESVLVEVTERKPQHLRAKPLEIVQPAPGRVAAPCRHFTRCGGCRYQHANYPLQVELKLSILRETLERVGKFKPPEHIEVLTGEPFGYRNRAQLHVDGSAIGYHEEGSRSVLGIEECPILSPKLQQVLQTMRRMLRDSRWPRFLRSLEVFTNETDLQLNVEQSTQPVAKRFFDWCAEEMPGFVPGALTYRSGGIDFRVSGGAFFQVNRFLIEPLVEAALAGAQGNFALDLYAGVGLFSLPLARRFAEVTAVESGTVPWRDLQFNAQVAGITLQAIHTSAESYLASTAGVTPDFVLADPPRAGLGKKVVQQLLAVKPRAITIVSCDTATLARDVAGLLPSYSIESMVMADLFPQTYHLETIVRLKLKD